jgi:hypothetical protein
VALPTYVHTSIRNTSKRGVFLIYSSHQNVKGEFPPFGRLFTLAQFWGAFFSPKQFFLLILTKYGLATYCEWIFSKNHLSTLHSCKLDISRLSQKQKQN